MKKWLVAAVLCLPVIAGAQNTCVGTIVLDYTNPPLQFLAPGAILNVQGSLGSGNIVGGTHVLYNKVQLNLDCVPSPTLTPQNCVDAGPAIAYLGDATITTSCPGIVWTSNNPGGGVLPNTVEFTATPVLAVPENSVNPPGFCTLNFDLQVVNEPPVVPPVISEILGYALAVCNTTPTLTTSGFQTASGGFAPPQGLDFQCLQTPRSQSSKPRVNVSLSDLFGTDPSVTVVRTHDFCTPVNKNGEDPTAPTNPLHFAAYVLDNLDSTLFSRPKGVGVTNQFGSFVVDIGAPVELYVPSSKSVVPAPPPAPLPADAANHFLCHNATIKSGPNVKAIPLSLIDQFSTPTAYAVQLEPKAVRLCAPVSKNNEPIVDADTFLFCMNTAVNPRPINEDINFVNQFFNFVSQDVPLTEFTEFCVTSSVVL